MATTDQKTGATARSSKKQRLSPEGASPAMAQWFTLKAENPDFLLFFRMGDFYELYLR
ncbi:hypothetical protein AAJCM20276_20330 [Acetobacter aceti]|uniref:DNA mismatch repair protein MutS-like N-terminal domain-containing protein n=1 Tax=Acetobacter aceti TaxID=435 RepID=A0A6S6PJC9_ACEAC|nr:hypothetical protein AAJCM20276_20330 [Acetobacter aceti]